MQINKAPKVHICEAVLRTNALSFSAKVLHGWLCKWANKDGKIDKSQKDMSEVMNMSQRAISAMLSQLVDCNLVRVGVTESEFEKNCYWLILDLPDLPMDEPRYLRTRNSAKKE